MVACCGNRPNHLCSEYYDPDFARIAQITDAKLFWKAFERRYGSNPEMTEDMKTRILPNIRSDFVQVETYDYKVTTEKYDLNERLESPMLCVAAKNDRRYHAMDFERWPELCSNNGNLSARRNGFEALTRICTRTKTLREPASLKSTGVRRIGSSSIIRMNSSPSYKTPCARSFKY